MNESLAQFIARILETNEEGIINGTSVVFRDGDAGSIDIQFKTSAAAREFRNWINVMVRLQHDVVSYSKIEDQELD